MWDFAFVVEDETQSWTRENAAVGAATPNCQPGQEVVEVASAAVLGEDVVVVVAWIAAAAAGAGEQRPKCECT